MNVPNPLNRRLCLVVSISLAFIILGPSVYPQQGENEPGKDRPTTTGPILKQSVIAGGGGTSTGGTIRVEASIGQPVVHNSVSSPLALNSGFWPGAIPCPFSLTKTAQMFGVGGGPGALRLIAASNCGWSAISDVPWIAFATKIAGNGNGELGFEVRENLTGNARQATVTIGDYIYTLVQDAGLGAECNFLLLPEGQSFPATGGAGAIQVVADDRCAWEAVVSNEVITITSNKVGIGNKMVTYTVSANPGASGRKGTITVGGKVFTVKQKGS
jgi:hypothetical protein